MEPRSTPLELPHLRPFVPAPLFKALEPLYDTFLQDSSMDTESPEFEEFLGFLREKKLVTSDVLSLLSTLVVQLREAAGHTLTVGAGNTTRSMKAVPPEEEKKEHWGDFFEEGQPDASSPSHSEERPETGSEKEKSVTTLPLIEEKLGEGGMGIVYRVFNPKLGRHEAIKQLRFKAPKDKNRKVRFIREAKITALLNHPGIVPIHLLFEDFHGAPAYSMKVVEGEHLGEWMDEIKEASIHSKDLPPEYSLDNRIQVFLRVCEAIHFAHNKAILHRDIKPSNILLGQFGEVYVVDWGVAKDLNDEAEPPPSDANEPMWEDPDHTYSGQILGTPGYMSPEQAQGKNDELDARSDLYALGMVLFELVYLKPARKGRKTLDVMTQALHGEVRFPNKGKQAKIPRELEGIIQKATASNLNDRYQSVEYLMNDLKAYLRGDAPEASPDTLLQLTLRKIYKNSRMVFQWGLVLVMILIALTAWALVERKQEELRQTTANQRKLRQYTTIINQARLLDRKLFRFEKRLGKLAAATRVSLLYGTPKDDKYFLNRSFAPKDLRQSEYYRDKVSLNHSVFKIAPNIEPASVEQEVKKLSLVQDYLKQLVYYDGEVNRRSYLKPKDLEKELLDGKLPIVSSFVGTSSGIMMLYPGRGSYAASYDNRKRPWFQTGLGHTGIRWSPPYVSSQNIRQVLVACTMSINPKGKQPQAVVGFDISLNVLSSFMETMISQTPWVKTAMLVNGKGQILVRTGHRYPAFNKKGKMKPKFPVIRFQKLKKWLKRKESTAWLSMRAKSQSLGVAFAKLKTIPWTYVVVGKGMPNTGK